jgi:transglutaminase-like putative cysteine protease
VRTAVSRAGACTLEVVHDTTYRYGSAVTLAHHLAHLQPLHDAHQQLLDFALHIDPAPAQLHPGHDAFGNAQHHFSLVQPHRELHVRSTSRLRVWPRFAALDAAASPPWDAVAAGLRYVACAPFQPMVAYAQPSPFVPRLPALRAWARPHFPPGRPLAEAALALMAALHREFRYDSASTEIDTPLGEAFALKRGVCQDFAHLLAGALRMLGLPARYVSGYLLTRPPEGGAPLVGADASHAWVQVWCPDTPGVPSGAGAEARADTDAGTDAHGAAGARAEAGADDAGRAWLDLDPTNDLVPGAAHVRLAVGRDFGDVTPLRGVIRGGGAHGLDVGVTTRLVAEGP